MNKKRKTFVSIICIVLAVLMALSLIMMVIPARASAISEADIELIRDRRELLNAQLQEQAEVIRQLSDGQALIIERKAALDRQIELNRQDIGLLEEEINLYDQMIWEKSLELENAQRVEKEQEERLRVRMRAMEENGDTSYLTFLFDAGSLSDLLSRMGDVSDIMHYDRDLMDALQVASETVGALKEEYETIRAQQDEVRGELSERREQLSGQISTAGALIAHLDELGDAAAAEYSAIEAAEAQAAEEEKAALAQLAAEREAARLAALQAQAAAANAGTAGTTSANPYAGTYESTYGAAASASIGGFIWPVDSTYVTSGFGSRNSPTAGASSNHPAIDIGAAAGSPIYAVADGQVAVATYNNGLGNYVSIAHGGDTSTRYSHMTNFIVQPGEYVTQGQIIGYVGQTGIATGDHLDFAVMQNGQAVNPLSYYDTSVLTFDPTA